MKSSLSCAEKVLDALGAALLQKENASVPIVHRAAGFYFGTCSNEFQGLDPESAAILMSGVKYYTHLDAAEYWCGPVRLVHKQGWFMQSWELQSWADAPKIGFAVAHLDFRAAALDETSRLLRINIQHA